MKSRCSETQDYPWLGIYVKGEWKQPVKLDLASRGRLDMVKVCQRHDKVEKIID
jgi:hypothetical protein